MAERKLTRRQKKELAKTTRETKANSQPAPRKVGQKATGWKVPLIFCAVILVVVAVAWGYRKMTAPAPLPLRQELLTLAAEAHIDLDADEEGRRYKEELIAAGRGFSPKYLKDEKVLAIAREALERGRVDVTVTAVHVLNDTGRRDEILRLLAKRGLDDCAALPWAVFAVRNLQDYPLAVDYTNKLNPRYDMCRGELEALAAEREKAKAQARSEADAASQGTADAGADDAARAEVEASADSQGSAENAPENAPEAPSAAEATASDS